MDRVRRFIFENRPIRGHWVHLSEAWRDLRAHSKYPPTVVELLGQAVAASVLPLLAIAVLGFLLYSAGAEPAEPKDKYQAWYIGGAVLISGALIVIFSPSSKRSRAGSRLQSPAS